MRTGDNIDLSQKGLWFGQYVRTTSEGGGSFYRHTPNNPVHAVGVIKEGPFTAEFNGTTISVVLVQYNISQFIVADTWVDITALTSLADQPV